MLELETLCAEVRNFFTQPDGKHYGRFTIEQGVFSPPLDFLKPGQYYRIVGSTFNDGVWQYNSDEVLTDEAFSGAVWAMNVPPSFIALCEKIQTWTSDNEKAIDSPYQSESFGGYSYTKAGGEGGATWQSHFRDELNRYRRIHL